MIRILYLGQKPIGEKCFSLLVREEIALCCAGSNTGNAAWWKSDRVRQEASALGIPFVDNADRHEDRLLEHIENLGIHCIISVQHPWILSKRLLDAVDNFAFNLHCAPLPEYQGYNVCNHAILNGETTFASTIHWMAPAVDAGDAAFVESFPVDATDTAWSLHGKAQAAGLRAFGRLAASLAQGRTPPRTALSGSPRFYSRQSIVPLRRVVHPEDALELDRKARAFWFPPFEPAYIMAGGRKFHVIPADADRNLLP